MTGTKADRRKGKIDMVITKSITRFVRNIVTLLEAVRRLKLLRVDVYFEKENIQSFRRYPRMVEDDCNIDNGSLLFEE